MNCIIIDDDKLSCQVVSEYVKKTSSLTLIGTYSNSIEARNILTKRGDIDLLFLDIQMPEMNGFELISSLESPPLVIVITADETYASKAFDMNAVDYLVKPVTYPRFCKAVDKTMRYSYKHRTNVQAEKEIFIKKGSSLVKLKIKDIVYVEALENYVTLYTNDDKFVIHFTMKGIEEYLPQGLFIRVHRSYIVNKTNIQAIRENLLDIVIGGVVKSMPVGKSFKDSLLDDINVVSR
jgi:DNA-binding LytR/AlgR family response regulator